MQPKLSDSEREKWNEEGWTPEAVGQVGAEILAASLGVKIGRAAAIKAECAKRDESETDILEQALAGDMAAQREISHKTHGLPWVALRSGKPDLKEIRALVDDLHKYRTRRATFHGLAVIDISDLAKGKDRLPRCQITGHALDDYDGKLEDGETGADYAKIWIEPRGNGRVLWIANRPDLLPGYAKDDPSRVVSELSNENVPTPYKRLEAAWLSASPVQKAQAEESLFNDPVAVSALPNGMNPKALQGPCISGGDKPLIFVLSHQNPKDQKSAESLRVHCALSGAELRLMSDAPPGSLTTDWIDAQIKQAAAVIGVLSPEFLFDDDLSRRFSSLFSTQKRALPFIARSCMWQEVYGGKHPLGGDRGDALQAAKELRALVDKLAPPPGQTPSRAALRQLLQERLVTANDFDSFCLDNFPAVFGRFSGGMDRVGRTTLLLEMVGQEALAAALQ